MKAITTGAIIVSLAAIAGCASHGSDDRYSHRNDRADYRQNDSGYNRTDGKHSPGTDSRRDGKWNSSDKSNRERDWQNRNDGTWNNQKNRS